MATFPSVTQSYGASKISAPKIRSTQFNDGYQHRIGFGLNTIPYVWALTFDVATKSNLKRSVTQFPLATGFTSDPPFL